MPIMLPAGDSTMRTATTRTILPSNNDVGLAPLSREQFDAASLQVYNRVHGTDVGTSPWEHIGRYSSGVLLDIADSLYASPIVPFGGDRGDVWSMASQEERDYYERHKGLIEGSSAIVGGLGIAVAAEALLVPRLAAGLASSTALTGTALWRTTRAWNVMSRVNMMRAQKLAAEAGEAYGLFSTQTGRAFLANRVAAGVATTTRTLPIEYGLMWNNEAFNSGEWDREGFWIGVGAAVGGAIGTVSARSAVRKLANSQEIRDIRAAPFASAGVTNNFLSPAHLDLVNRIDPNSITLKESALTTEFLVGRRAANPSGYDEASENATRLNSNRAQFDQLAYDSIQKSIVSGIPGVDTLRIQIKDMPEIRNILDQTAKVDPFIFHGAAAYGIPKTSIKEARTSRQAHIEMLRKQADVAANKGFVKEAQRLNRLQRQLKLQDESVLVNSSWMNPDSELAQAAVEHSPERVLKRIDELATGEALKIDLPQRGKIMLDASLTPLDAGQKAVPVEKLSIKDRFTLDEAANQLVRKLSSKNAKTRFQLTNKSAKSWYSLDLAAEVIDSGGKIEFSLKGPKGQALQSVDDLRRESLRIKAKAALAEVGELGRITPELRFKYNLPAPTAMERLEDATGDGFRHWLQVAAKDEGTYRELAQGLADYRTIQGIDLLAPGGQYLPRVDGDMLRFNRNKKGTWLRPMLGYFDPPGKFETLSQRAHSNAMTLRKAEKTYLLMNNQSHVSDLVKTLVQMPELTKAMDTAGLHSDQITGLGGGLKQALGEVLPKRFRARDNATILSATKLQEATEKHGLATFKNLMASVGMQNIVTRITSTGHAPQRAALDQYFSLRSGWDIEEAVPVGDNMFGFKLRDTEGNRRRLGVNEVDEWEDGVLMPNQRLNKPIVVDGDSLEVIKAYNRLTQQLREADNSLRRAKGHKDIGEKEWYTPPPDTRGALVGFVFDRADQLVPGRTIVARNPDEYRALQKRTLDELGHANGYTIRTREQLASLRDVWDEVAMDWIDPGISPATAGVGNQRGGLVGAYVRDGAFLEALDWIKRKSIVQSQDALKQLMAEPLTISRMMAATESSVNGQKNMRNIFHEYEAALLGTTQAYRDTAVGDKILRTVEESVNKALANSAITYPARYVVDLAQRVGMDPTDLNGKKTFAAISASMGKYTPYANAVEFMESRGIKRPPTVKSMAQTMNTMAAGVLLRWFELPHAMMNGLGLIATMPAAVLSGRAPISTFTNVKGRNVGFVDGAKIIAQGMQDMFTKRSGADWKYMEKMGDTGQSVMEYHQALGAIHSKAGFMKWLDKADKTAGWLSDSSENWSRQVAHFVGLRLADYQGIKGMAARHNFAREIANSMIADYAPINRPELFQSGFGSMIGLFQSYALNHYTKMFRWMENGEYGKVGIQAAMQAAMFGLPGTYGIGHLLDLRDSMTASGSEPTALDLIYEHFGPVLGGAIAHGSVSQLTQLALWTRGDTNFRIPGANGTLAPLEIGTKVARGFVDGVGAYLNAMPGEGVNAMMEVVQREMPNRVLRSWLTILNGGKEIDAYGQVMAETRTWMDTVARVVGVRSTRQQAELEAYYAGKGAIERDAAKMERLRESFRAAVRNNRGNFSEVNPIQYFNDYVEAGGNPRLFKTWVRNLLRDADSSRAVNGLKTSLSTTRSALETWRFGAYGALPVE